MRSSPSGLAVFLGLAARAQSQLIAFPAVPTWGSGLCTDKSLTIPSWIVSDFATDGSSSSFDVANRAVGTTYTVSCAAGAASACSVSGDGNLTAAVTSSTGSGSTPVVSLAESWSCSDNDLGVVTGYEATGSVAIESLDDSSGSSPIPWLAYGTLTAPVPLTPAQPGPPPGYNLSTCADVDVDAAAAAPLWTVSGIEFRNYTTSQCEQWYEPEVVCITPTTFIKKGLYLSATVTNGNIEDTVSCDDLTLSDDPTFFPTTTGGVLVHCAGGGGAFGEIALDLALTGTPPNADFQLTVAQLWYCLEDPATNAAPTAYSALGSSDAPLTCTTAAGITGAADDLITTCTAGEVGVAVDESEVETEPEFALVTAGPASGGCTAESVVDPTWTFIQTDWQTSFANSTVNQSLWEFGTRFRTPGFSEWWYGFIGEDDLPGGEDPSTWYQCQWSVPGDWEPWKCQFQFNYKTREVGMISTWECSDKDPAHPLYWHTNGTVTLTDAGLMCGNDNPDINSCYYNGGEFSETFPVPYYVVNLTNVEPPRPFR
ncbi:hypothetical protein GGR56DRAFT_604082 [Xylariaceae sp. FL0804]|nr:hypothetical protein GGR56DRAFT_604082 [Xylariaceae sp. FL0804]